MQKLKSQNFSLHAVILTAKEGLLPSFAAVPLRRLFHTGNNALPAE
jgi:hypothetical protein